MRFLLDQVMGEVGQVSGDRAYDTGKCYQAMLDRGASDDSLAVKREVEFSQKSASFQGRARGSATPHQE